MVRGKWCDKSPCFKSLALIFSTCQRASSETFRTLWIKSIHPSHPRHATHASPLCDWHTRRPTALCRRCVGVLIGSVSARTRQYFVPCAYMHAVVPPASSHARLTLDWLAISRALPVHHCSCVGVSLPMSRDMCLEVGHLVPCHKDVVTESPGSRTELARRRYAVCHQRR